ncbi:HD domain-containing protein [Nonomuraea sp. NPDC050556]|uniref:HD domain-containing protein n=1 Tax=Nonomuraea sp. NPDC050556 TaxID=3364369 RepID=UPI00379BE751
MSIQEILDGLPDQQRELVERAHVVASYWHRDQRRASGEPYISHPVAVAAILAELGQDHEMLCAALLHDTGLSEEELAREFGPGIAGLVRDVAALDGQGGWERRVDERVLTLKLADRLHNQRTMHFLPREKQRRKSRETLQIYAPVARWLGMDQVALELEQLAGPPGGSFRLISAGAVILPAEARARWLREWLGELHALPAGRARLWFAAQLLWGMPRMAATLRRMRLGGFARWIVASDVRVWALLTPPLAWLVVDTAMSRLGDALTLVITVPPALAAGIHVLRERFKE